MNWRTEWRAIADRISGLTEAYQVFIQQLRVSNSDGYAVKRKHLLPACRAVYGSIEDYRARHRDQLPDTAAIALDRFVNTHGDLLRAEQLDNIEAVGASMTFLAGFRSEMEYQLADSEAASVRLAERAFTHLQRLIVADPNAAASWQRAFQEGELACERLGSVHLLSHGIWAFKISAAGERTDLVFSESLLDANAVASAAESLVLTEWKLVRAPSQMTAQLEQAQHQADLYARGSLAGLELKSRRYLVMVSADRLNLPPDFELNGIRYCPRNVAVKPSRPSAAP